MTGCIFEKQSAPSSCVNKLKLSSRVQRFPKSICGLFYWESLPSSLLKHQSETTMPFKAPVPASTVVDSAQGQTQVVRHARRHKYAQSGHDESECRRHEKMLKESKTISVSQGLANCPFSWRTQGVLVLRTFSVCRIQVLKSLSTT